ncbi:MAG: nucleotide exchange factor GrpE [Clostridia bacterium]|nr:nucleotide exchange factor GrpE [Clostridia bacterium]
MEEKKVTPDVETEEIKTEEKPAKKTKSAKKDEVERLKAELAAAQAEAEDCKRKWYNVSAEYENYRRRTQAQAAQRYAEGRNDIVTALFPVGDNLSRAIAVCADENTKHGMEMVLKSFQKILEEEGIEEIDPIGQPFDPSLAEAIMAMPAADGEEAGIVKMVHEKGYKKGERVLRYAKVVVTQ